MTWKKAHQNFVDEKTNNLTLNRLKLGSALKIQDKKFTVIGKALYSEGLDWCYKIFLSDNHMIIYMHHDDLDIVFGKYVDDVNYQPPFPNKINYHGKEFIADLAEKQIIDEHIFGQIEGECDFWDYSSGSEYLSLAIMTDTGKRADVYSKKISVQDIEIISE